MKDWINRFQEGFKYTAEERLELFRVAEHNRSQYEAIMGGYSVASRRYVAPEVPSIFERILRGVDQILD